MRREIQRHPGTPPRSASILIAMSIVALLACAPGLGGAQEPATTDEMPRRTPLVSLAERAASARLSAQRMVSAAATANDTTWVGYRAGVTSNHWSIGTGPSRGNVDERGMWTWDTPVHGDSLQGWWPIRMAHTNTSGAVRTDENRPWWAIEIGNQANYVINQGRFDAAKLGTAYAGNRTYGVVGVWHSDPGNSTPGLGVNWTPLAGARSAWMGMRRHGDLTAVDPVTGNAFDADLMMFDRAYSSTAVRAFPGYGAQMDQMLYRDIDLSGAPADSGVRITFRYRTEMSTLKGTAAASRTGWFEGDPLSVNTVTPGNFISAEAGVPANSLAPVDSFQVYVGAPVEGTWKGSDNLTRSVYDPLRRWFNEVLAKDTRYWKFGKAGADSGEVTLVLAKAQKDAIVAAAGAPTLRVVFRVHTNAGSSDESGIATYSSNGRGAAQVDDVRYDAGLGAVTIGDFEGTDPAKDIDNLQPASAAWRSTGKPPAITFHTHPLATLTWGDLCGLPGSSTSQCNLRGAVIAQGDHDDGETLVGPQGSTEEAGNWGIMSPTIGLEASPGVENAFGLTQEQTFGDYVIKYEQYGEVFDIFTQGHSWQFMFQTFVGQASSGTGTWTDINLPTFLLFNPLHECGAYVDAMTSVLSTGEPPDSIRIGYRRLAQNYRFGVTSGYDIVAGAYLDNISFGIVHHAEPPVTADIWDWFQDTFPFNENASLPGTAAFDTTSALIRTGLNIAQLTGSLDRFDVPADSAVATASGPDVRMDLVFRVYPGPGNHVTVGNRESGLRRVPTSPIPAAPGDGSWWGSWTIMPGDFATPGAGALHAAWPGGWNPNVWMSARCDTAQMNVFAIEARGIGVPTNGRWMSTYHESDPHFATLGVARNMCFLVDAAGANDASNITCSSVPAWVSAGGTGYDGSPTTVEGTSIFPDGLFTPGTHFEYFWRRSLASSPATMVAMCPDTNLVVPQPGEDSYDGHRWQQFGVLPDRWKEVSYGGAGGACMLVVDAADRRGEELAWISAADSVGLTYWPWATYNGWHSYTGLSPNDPAGFSSVHGGQAGLVFDFYQVKASELSATSAGTIGSRLAYRDPSPLNLVHGKYSTQGPTFAMLAAYYKMVLWLGGDLYVALGPFPDHSQDDKGILTQFLQDASSFNPRAFIAFGDGFAAALNNDPFLTDVLGVYAPAYYYTVWTGDPTPTLRLTPSSSFMPGGYLFGVRNSCPLGPGVIAPLTANVPEATTGATMGLGASPVTGVVHKPMSAMRPWYATTHAFAFQRLVTDGGPNTRGRTLYLHRLIRGLYSSLCYFPGDFFADVPDATPAYVDGVRLLNTPLARGSAVVEFTLAAPDRVTIGLYDIGGRLVRTLAEKPFEAGAQRIAWDGTDNTGRRLNAGVYFARVRYAARGFESARKVIVLK